MLSQIQRSEKHDSRQTACGPFTQGASRKSFAVCVYSRDKEGSQGGHQQRGCCQYFLRTFGNEASKVGITIERGEVGA